MNRHLKLETNTGSAVTPIGQNDRAESSFSGGYEAALVGLDTDLAQSQASLWKLLLENASNQNTSHAAKELGRHYFLHNHGTADITRIHQTALNTISRRRGRTIYLMSKRFTHQLEVAQTAILQALEMVLAGFYESQMQTIEQETGNRFADKMLDRTIDLSISVNEVAATNASVMKEVSQIEGRAQTIADAVHDMAGRINDISQHSDEIVSRAATASKTAQDGANTIQTTAENMHRVARAVSESTRRVESLAETSGRISEMVLTVESIAAQTNLLALNATIEAARAGDAGKGFAVVAGEVKNLSSQTAKATEDIRETIAALTTEISAIVSSMTEGGDAVVAGEESMKNAVQSMELIGTSISGVNSRMTEIAKTLLDQQKTSDDVAKRVREIADTTSENAAEIRSSIGATDHVVERIAEQIAILAEYDVPQKAIRIAKSDHVIWKKRLSDMLIGHESLSTEELSSHINCRLGKWYYGEHGQTLTDADAYRKLEEPHRIVHECGIEAVKCYNEGDLDSALEMYEKVDIASRDVLRLLDDLITRPIDSTSSSSKP